MWFSLFLIFWNFWFYIFWPYGVLTEHFCEVYGGHSYDCRGTQGQFLVNHNTSPSFVISKLGQGHGSHQGRQECRSNVDLHGTRSFLADEHFTIPKMTSFHTEIIFSPLDELFFHYIFQNAFYYVPTDIKCQWKTVSFFGLMGCFKLWDYDLFSLANNAISVQHFTKRNSLWSQILDWFKKDNLLRK